MKPSAKAIFTHLFVFGFFIVAALGYFHPVLQGKAIYQSDIAQYKGMAEERNSYKETTGIESYWTNSAFGGMPTYQLGANYPHDYVKKLDHLIRFLPRPADYLFLYFLGFYILMLCMKVDYRLAILGALAFGFSTYFIIILGVGHNAKAHALGYIPMVLGGIVLVFRKKYVLGFLLTAVAMALEISANHYQMTYYFMLLVLILGLVHLIYAIKNKKLKHFFSAVGILLGAVLLAISTNATSLMATKEYADWSTRGPSELTINADGSEKEISNGLDRDYITQYSYGISESLNLYVPRLFGGSNGEALGKNSNSYKFLTEQGISPSTALDFSNSLPLYWGKQPIVAGPAYLGAVVFLLFVLSLFLVRGKKKWWLLAGAILALLLSWGKNYPDFREYTLLGYILFFLFAIGAFFIKKKLKPWIVTGALVSILIAWSKFLPTPTNFMIDYFPLYNKFRAVSSIQVLIELCVPVMAILGLKALTSSKIKSTTKLRALKLSVIMLVGLGVALFLLKGLFNFEGANDARLVQAYGEQIMSMIEQDRAEVFTNDIFRSLIFVLLTGTLLFLYVKDKLKTSVFTLLLGLLLVIDLGGVAKRYVDQDDFIRTRAVEQPFQASTVDREILRDQSNFRVFDPQEALNGARTSFFHKSLGGYHAAKPRKMEELVEFHLYKNNLQVLNMLNVKYIVQQDADGQRFPGQNPDANGNAWFVEQLQTVETANAAIKGLDSLNTKTTAIINTKDFPKAKERNFVVGPSASIKVMDYRPDTITYETNNSRPGYIVFSEMYYPHGWKSTLDGKLVEHDEVNYALRGIAVPAGNHKIIFSFEPEVVQKGSTIALAGTAVFGIFLLGSLALAFRKKKPKAAKERT